MAFEERLGILLDGGVISAEVEALVRRAVSRLGDRWGIALTEEKGGRMVTHLAMALMRIRGGEEIAPPEGDALEEFRDTGCFPQAVKITGDLIGWTPFELPEAERDYLIINLCLILDAGDEGSP